MTKQEEIREHLIEDLMNYKGFDRAPTETIIDCVLGSLSLEDVVIKVDENKLPTISYNTAYPENEEIYQQAMLKAGYVAVEPLIKEEPDG